MLQQGICHLIYVCLQREGGFFCFILAHYVELQKSLAVVVYLPWSRDGYNKNKASIHEKIEESKQDFLYKFS